MDLYAGSGSFGIECLSRDASEVIFVEKDREAIKNLKKNVEQLNLDEKYKIIERDIYDFIKNTKFKIKFDIIFLDPPYKNEDFANIIQLLKEKKFVNKNHIILIHREKNKQNNLDKYLKIIDSRIYGRSQIFLGEFFQS